MMHKLLIVLIFLLFLMHPVAADQITIRDAEYTVNSTLTNPQSLTQTTLPTMVKVRYADVGYKTDLEKPLVNQTTLPTMIMVRHADVSYRSGIEKPLVEQTTLPTMIGVRYADVSYRTGLEEPTVNQTTLPTMIMVRHADVIFKSNLSDGFGLSDLPVDQEPTGPTPGKTAGNAEILESLRTAGTVEPWSEVAAAVVISNTGTTTRSFWVGLSYKKQGTSTWINIPPQQSVDLYPGGSANVQFSWTLTDEAGTYDLLTKIWDGYDASTDQMIPPSYDEQIDIGAFIISDTAGQPPIVSFTYSPSNPVVNQSVTFNASTSYAPAGTIVKYVWDFGDGSDATGIRVTHSYSKIGDYNVILMATDDKAATNTASKVIKACSDTQKTALPYESIQSDGFGHHIKFQLFGPDTVNRDTSVNYVARIESVRSDGTPAQNIIMRGNVYTSYEDDIIELYPVSIKERWDGEWHDIDPEQDWNEGSIRDALSGELVNNAIPIPGLGILLALFTENPPEPEGSMFYNENQYDIMQIPFTPPTKWNSRYVPIVGHQPHPNAIEIQIPYKFTSTGSHQIHFFMWAQAMAPSSPVNTSDFYISVDVT